MDLSKVKLIATDMDGTLLNDQGEVSDEFFSLFTELKELGVTFVAASGRQYFSIIDKLAPIKNDMYVIAENGALSMYKDKELGVTAIDRDTFLEILKTTEDIPNAKVILCGLNSGYIIDYGKEFIEMFSEYYGRYKIVSDLASVKDDLYLKVAICHQDGAEKNVYPFVKHLENTLKVKVSGEIWLDLSHVDANKGNALQKLQQQLNIEPSETLVFGDYNNDLEMLEQAEFSFAMENAHPNVLNTAKCKTESNNNHGVEKILKELIQQKKATLVK